MSQLYEQELYERVVGLADVLDDYRSVTVALSPYPLIKITNVTIPSSAKPNATVNFSISFINNGGDGTAWVRVYDNDTKEDIIPRSESPISAGGTGLVAHYFVMPNRDKHIRIEMGHVT